jgi:serine/threonine protein kinase
MKKYGPSLKAVLRRSKYKRFSIKSTVQIGMQLLDRLEDLHN